MRAGRSGAGDGLNVDGLEEAGLNEEVLDATRLDLDEVAASCASRGASRILMHECLLDDEVRLGEDAQLRAERLLLGCEEVQRGAASEVERGRCWNEIDGGGEGDLRIFCAGEPVPDTPEVSCLGVASR